MATCKQLSSLCCVLTPLALRSPQAKGFGLSCYVHDSLPAVLYLAYKYAEPSQASQALLANTNVGGNTVHRGAILGAILGAVSLQTPTPTAGLAMSSQQLSGM